MNTQPDSSQKSSRLVIATTDLPPAWGGIQRLVHELATQLAGDGWLVSVVAPGDADAERYDSAVPFRVHRTAASWAGSRLRCLAEMAMLLRRAPADVYLAAHVNALPPLVLSRPRARKAVLYHGSELWVPMSRFVTRALSSRIDRAMAVSRFTAGEVAKAGVARDRIVVTSPGAGELAQADDDAILTTLGLASEHGDVPFFVTVSRLVEPEKGQDVVLHALPAILRDESSFKYVIAGDGPLRGRLTKLADELGVRDAVRFTGSVDEPTKGALLRRCVAYAMVSRESRRPAQFEGFGITYLEAALAGRPSLAGRSGGAADAVVDGVTGVLVDPTSADAVAEAALALLNDRQRADALGEAARRRAESEFTWDVATRRMGDVLQALARGAR